MRNKIEYGYEEIPINFLSRSSSKGQLGSTQGFHSMSVPMVQMLKAERDNMMKEAEKKQAADRALKEKLKSFGQPQGNLSKRLSEAKIPKPSQPKPEPHMNGTSFRVLRLPERFPTKSHTQPFFSSQESSPRLLDDANSPIGNGKEFYQRDFQNVECESPLKSSFVSTTFADRRKHYKSYASLEVNYGATENDNDTKLNLRLMHSEIKSPVHTLQTLAGSKTPQLKVEWHNLEDSPVEEATSPKKRFASKISVLELLRRRELSPLLHDPPVKFGGDHDKKTIKLKTLSQNPSEDRLFAMTDLAKGRKSKLVSPVLPKINGLVEEDLGSSQVLKTEENHNSSGKKKKTVFNFSPEISKFLSSPKGKGMVILPKMNSPSKRLQQNQPSKEKVVENKVERSPPKPKQLIEFLPKKITVPANPIFAFEENDEQDIHIRQMEANEQEDMPEEEKRKLKFSILRRKLLRCLKKMKNLKLSPQELLDAPMIFNSEPYTKAGSKQFLEAAKLGRLSEMQEIIEDKNRYLIYDFDNVHMTALHYAAKKGYTDMAKFLIASGANVEARDIIGRTPLYFAIQNNHIDILKILLANRCQTWSNEETGYAELCKNNQIAWFYLSKMRKLDITLKLTPPNLREIIWQRESQEILRRKYVAEEGPAQKRLD